MTPVPPDNRPPGVPPQPPRADAWSQPAPARETRGVAFFVAIFLGILLVASAGLNVLLLLLSVGSLAGAGLGDAEAAYDEVHVAGERTAPLRVLKIAIHGAIGEAQNPILGAAGGMVTQVRRALQRAAADDVHGVLLDIDSPGGGVTDSDEIYDLIRKFRREQPKKRVIALFGDMAASGGYYVAVAAERIVARVTTITGSIGVIMSSYNVTEAAKKLGIEEVVIKSDRTPWKDILSPMRPMTVEERRMLTTIVDELFDRFVTVVDEGRDNLDRQQVLAAATGAVYTASQALERGLIDEIGNQDTVVKWYEQELGGEIALFERRRRVGFADLLFGSHTAVPTVDQSVGRLLTGSLGPRFLYFWEGGR